jgi:hypothetical protein
VVAGKRYCFTYEYELFAEDGSSLGPTQSEYCVLSQPWENNYYRLTTDDGRIFVKGGSAGSFSAIFLGPAQDDVNAGTDETTITDSKTI